MTHEQQRRFYFPAWNALAAAAGWRMVKGRLAIDIEEQSLVCAAWPDPAGELYRKVVTLATQFAIQEHRAVNAADLRYACNFAGCGKKSSQDLNNKDVNLVVLLMDSLREFFRDPENLSAITAYLNPDRKEKDSFIAFLEKRAHEGVLAAVASNAFGTKNWRELPIEKLRWLSKKLKDRQRVAAPQQRDVASNYRQRDAASSYANAPAQVYDPANAPF
jgi:hypothetical protein